MEDYEAVISKGKLSKSWVDANRTYVHASNVSCMARAGLLGWIRGLGASTQMLCRGMESLWDERAGKQTTSQLFSTLYEVVKQVLTQRVIVTNAQSQQWGGPWKPELSCLPLVYIYSEWRKSNHEYKSDSGIGVVEESTLQKWGLMVVISSLFYFLSTPWRDVKITAVSLVAF